MKWSIKIFEQLHIPYIHRGDKNFYVEFSRIKFGTGM
jgi:hypothetical protein